MPAHCDPLRRRWRCRSPAAPSEPGRLVAHRLRARRGSGAGGRRRRQCRRQLSGRPCRPGGRRPAAERPTISSTRWRPRRAMPICAARCSSCCSASGEFDRAVATARLMDESGGRHRRGVARCWPWTLPDATKDRRRWRCSSVWAPPTSPGRCSRCCWPGRISPPARGPRRSRRWRPPTPIPACSACVPSTGRRCSGWTGARATASPRWRGAFPDLAEAPARVLRGGLALQLAAGDRAGAEQLLAKVREAAPDDPEIGAAGGGGGQRRRRSRRGPRSRHRHGRRADQHRRGLLRAGPQRRSADAGPRGDLRRRPTTPRPGCSSPASRWPRRTRPRRCGRSIRCPRTARSPGRPG